MEPKLKYKREVGRLTDGFGVDYKQVEELIDKAINETECTGETLAELWNRAPSPAHAILGAFFVGCIAENARLKIAMSEVTHGGDSGKGPYVH